MTPAIVQSINATSDHKVAAAIKLGFATRILATDYLEECLTHLADEFETKELLSIDRLVGEISRLALALEYDRCRGAADLGGSTEFELREVKLPALRVHVDHSIFMLSGHAKWYQLGATWADCINRMECGETNLASADCWARFTEVCRQLSPSELSSMGPCRLWIEYWSASADPATVMRRVFQNLSPEMQNRACENTDFSDRMRFLYLMIDFAASSGLAILTEGPIPPDKFAFDNVVYQGLRTKPYRLIEVLWTAQNRTVANIDLAREVWGDPTLQLTHNELGSAQSKANRFFENKSIPFRIETRDKCRYAILIDQRQSSNDS